jgi:HTH-type transcriptional regulator, competence development regulator
MKTSSSELGQYIRSLRSKKGETLHEVSKGTDIDSPMLSKIERGDRIPTLEQLTKLSKYFKVDEAELKVMHTAEKIIKEYGLNETTYEAVRMVKEQITPYIKKSNSK